MTTVTPIFIQHGATFAPLLSFFQDDAATVVVDLTGATLTITDSTFPVASTPTLTINTPTTAGLATLTLSAALTATLVIGRTYTLRIKQVSLNGTVIYNGPFTMLVQ